LLIYRFRSLIGEREKKKKNIYEWIDENRVNTSHYFASMHFNFTTPKGLKITPSDDKKKERKKERKDERKEGRKKKKQQQQQTNKQTKKQIEPPRE